MLYHQYNYNLYRSHSEICCTVRLTWLQMNSLNCHVWFDVQNTFLCCSLTYSKHIISKFVKSLHFIYNHSFRSIYNKNIYKNIALCFCVLSWLNCFIWLMQNVSHPLLDFKWSLIGIFHIFFPHFIDWTINQLSICTANVQPTKLPQI